MIWMIVALIGILPAVLALQLLRYFQEKRFRANFPKQIEELKQRLEQQQREIEELKSQKIVMPS